MLHRFTTGQVINSFSVADKFILRVLGHLPSSQGNAINLSNLNNASETLVRFGFFTIFSLILLCALNANTANAARTKAFSANTCAPLTEPLSFEKIKAKFDSCGIKTMEGAIAILPESYRERYTLVYSGRGPQRASPSHPRAVLFGADAQFVFTFNGHQSHRGFQDLEVMEFDQKSDRLAFKLITFPDNASDEVTYSEPPMCLNCHGRTWTRPIWEMAPLWPGVYGSENDDLFRPQGLIAQSEEAKLYRAFLNGARNDSRYGQLKDYVPGFLPNTELDRLLTGINVRIVAAELDQNSALRPYRYAIFAALACSESHSIETFIAPKVARTFTKNVADLANNTFLALQDDFSFRLQRQARTELLGPQTPRIQALASIKSAEQLSREIDRPSITTSLRYVIENVSKIEVGPWSMAFPASTHSFGETDHFARMLERALAEKWLANSDHEIYKAMTAPNRDVPALCHALKNKSMATTQSL